MNTQMTRQIAPKLFICTRDYYSYILDRVRYYRAEMRRAKRDGRQASYSSYSSLVAASEAELATLVPIPYDPTGRRVSPF